MAPPSTPVIVFFPTAVDFGYVAIRGAPLPAPVEAPGGTCRVTWIAQPGAPGTYDLAPDCPEGREPRSRPRVTERR